MCFHDTMSRWIIQWVRPRQEGGRLSDRVNEKLRNMNGLLEKKRQNEGCDLSVLQCVSLSLSPWQVCNSGEPWTESSSVHTAAHRGFTGWQTEPRAVLSTAYHSAVCGKSYSLNAHLTATDQPPVLFTYLHTKHFDLEEVLIQYDLQRLWKKIKAAMLVFIFRNQRLKLFKSDFLLTTEWDTSEFCVSVADRFLIFETWKHQEVLWCEINARKHNKLSRYSLLSNVIVRHPFGNV